MGKREIEWNKICKSLNLVSVFEAGIETFKRPDGVLAGTPDVMLLKPNSGS